MILTHAADTMQMIDIFGVGGLLGQIKDIATTGKYIMAIHALIWICGIRGTKKTYAKTREEAMRIVDEELVKAGWKLLNEGDKLLSLL